ncbi:DUF4123 domain-containing protein [Marinobacterium lutimaris]|uniref:DUF4123 domain-containing protein n=1 Tax=Marinobacterium lutimaris TaxID=568106 RepID=A0A1H5UDA9_9GAMM|nr:DUF4123 domain-containing protein [Marinobacterium lutimaris]SEF73004.1 protein of unknown function [Marinobacterium lutimaris]
MELIDHYSDDWITETHTLVEQNLSSQAWVYLLIDASFKHETCLSLVRRLFPTDSWYALYKDSPDTSDHVLAVSPLLIQLNANSLDSLASIARETSGYPMLSLIASSETLETLALRFSTFRVVKVQDSRYILRLADTRRLPQILEVLHQDQRELLTGNMLSWSYIGRDALWHSLPFDQIESAEPNKLVQIEFDDTQTQRLSDMNRIDAVIDGLRRNEPGLFNGLAPPSKRYDWVVKVLDDAQSSASTFATQIQCCRQAALEEGISL